MKILLINNHHKTIGGTERYYFDLAKLLTERGHEVAFFSTNDPGNKRSKWQRYFVDKVDFSKNGVQTFFSKLCRMFYSFDSKKRIAVLLDDFKPDIVHLQNIYYYISPSILSEIKRRKIPIVQTVHDYQLITPSVTFFHNGKICEITKKHKYFLAFFHRCVKGSYVASLMAVIASHIQHYFRFYEKYVDCFIAPSKFLKQKLIEYGFNAKKIIYLPNFIYATNFTQNYKGSEKFVLYFGRFAEQKGLIPLLLTAEKLPNVNFKLTGFYENKEIQQNMLDLIKNRNINNVEIINYLTGQKLKSLITKSAFTVVPSLWYENQPYAILESYALGKPVVAGRIGGIPEIVGADKTGLLFDPGNADNLTKKINYLWNHPQQAARLGLNAYHHARTKFAPDLYYNKLLNIYKKHLLI